MPTRIEVESNVLEVQDSGEIVTLDGNPAFVVGLQMEIPRHYDGEAFRTPGVGVIEQIFLLYPGARILPDGGPVKGGAGSGNHGHAGRPGKRGGSAPNGSAPATATEPPQASANYDNSLLADPVSAIINNAGTWNVGDLVAFVDAAGMAAHNDTRRFDIFTSGDGVDNAIVAMLKHSSWSDLRPYMETLGSHEWLAGKILPNLDYSTFDRERDAQWIPAIFDSFGGYFLGSYDNLQPIRPDLIEYGLSDRTFADMATGNGYSGAPENIGKWLGFLNDTAHDVGGYARSNLKGEIIKRLSAQTGVSGDVINQMLFAWAGNSNHGRWSEAVQQEAAEMFGAGLSEWQRQPDKQNTGMPVRPERVTWDEKHRPAIRKVLQQMYDNTQELFAHFGVKEVVLYRGTGLPDGINASDGGTIAFDDNALASWTFGHEIGIRFLDRSGEMGVNAGVLAAKVPVDRILCTPYTGLGCLPEMEAVIIGGNEPAYGQMLDREALEAYHPLFWRPVNPSTVVVFPDGKTESSLSVDRGGKLPQALLNGARMEYRYDPTLAKKSWDESKHPRHGAGSPDGGQFAPAGTGDITGEGDEFSSQVTFSNVPIEDAPSLSHNPANYQRLREAELWAAGKPPLRGFLEWINNRYIDAELSRQPRRTQTQSISFLVDDKRALEAYAESVMGANAERSESFDEAVSRLAPYAQEMLGDEYAFMRPVADHFGISHDDLIANARNVGRMVVGRILHEGDFKTFADGMEQATEWIPSRQRGGIQVDSAFVSAVIEQTESVTPAEYDKIMRVGDEFVVSYLGLTDKALTKVASGWIEEQKSAGLSDREIISRSLRGINDATQSDDSGTRFHTEESNTRFHLAVLHSMGDAVTTDDIANGDSYLYQMRNEPMYNGLIEGVARRAVANGTIRNVTELKSALPSMSMDILARRERKNATTLDTYLAWSKPYLVEQSTFPEYVEPDTVLRMAKEEGMTFDDVEQTLSKHGVCLTNTFLQKARGEGWDVQPRHALSSLFTNDPVSESETDAMAAKVTLNEVVDCYRRYAEFPTDVVLANDNFSLAAIRAFDQFRSRTAQGYVDAINSITEAGMNTLYIANSGQFVDRFFKTKPNVLQMLYVGAVSGNGENKGKFFKDAPLDGATWDDVYPYLVPGALPYGHATLDLIEKIGVDDMPDHAAEAIVRSLNSYRRYDGLWDQGWLPEDLMFTERETERVLLQKALNSRSKLPDITNGNVIEVGTSPGYGEWLRSTISENPDDDASPLKERIVGDLYTAAGRHISFEEADRFIRQWAVSSNGGDTRSLNIQLAAAEEFGVELSPWQQADLEGAERQLLFTPADPELPLYWTPEGSADEIARMRGTLRAMYEGTQQHLKEAGVSHVRLYRGVKLFDDPKLDLPIGTDVEFDDNALASWSLSPGVAKGFGDFVMTAAVPADKILSTCRTGFGCLREEEVVVIGNPGVGHARVYLADGEYGGLEKVAQPKPLYAKGSAAKAWDEAKHPRHRAGTSEGGQFAPADGAASTPAMSEDEIAAKWPKWGEKLAEKKQYANYYTTTFLAEVPKYYTEDGSPGDFVEFASAVLKLDGAPEADGLRYLASEVQHQNRTRYWDENEHRWRREAHELLADRLVPDVMPELEASGWGYILAGHDDLQRRIARAILMDDAGKERDGIFKFVVENFDAAGVSSDDLVKIINRYAEDEPDGPLKLARTYVNAIEYIENPYADGAGTEAKREASSRLSSLLSAETANLAPEELGNFLASYEFNGLGHEATLNAILGGSTEGDRMSRLFGALNASMPEMGKAVQAKIDSFYNEAPDAVTGKVHRASLSNQKSRYGQAEWDRQISAKKNTVVKGLAKILADDPTITYGDINQVVGAWAGTSNNSLKSIWLQKIAAEEFGVEMGTWQQQKYDELTAGKSEADILAEVGLFNEVSSLGEHETKLRKILRAMKKRTDKWTKSNVAGGRMTLFRGVNLAENPGFKPGDIVQADDNALSSWSTAYSVAESFAMVDSTRGNSAVVLSVSVPTSQILSNAHTGLGCWDEQEVVVIGVQGAAHAKVVAVGPKESSGYLRSEMYPKYLDADTIAYKALAMKGGAGSGNHGHAGRPGKRGGSAPDTAAPITSMDEFREKWPMVQAGLAYYSSHHRSYPGLLFGVMKREMGSRFTPQMFIECLGDLATATDMDELTVAVQVIDVMNTHSRVDEPEGSGLTPLMQEVDAALVEHVKGVVAGIAYDKKWDAIRSANPSTEKALYALLGATDSDRLVGLLERIPDAESQNLPAGLQKAIYRVFAETPDPVTGEMHIGDLAWQSRAYGYSDDETQIANKKNTVVKGLVRMLEDDPSITYGNIDMVVKGWAGSSNGSLRSLWLQKIAADEFGAPLSAWQQESLREWTDSASDKDIAGMVRLSLNESTLGETEEKLRKILRAMRTKTGKWLKKNKIDRLTLYRGVSIDEGFRGTIGDVIRYDDNTLSSWSSSYSVASGFAAGGMVLAINVPADRVLSNAHTGIGCWDEAEYVVIGAPEAGYAKVLAFPGEVIDNEVIFGDQIDSRFWPDSTFEQSSIVINPSIKGGAGSGNHGHAGRPGKRGGSAPADSAPATQVDDDDREFDPTTLTEADIWRMKGLTLGIFGQWYRHQKHIADQLTPDDKMTTPQLCRSQTALAKFAKRVVGDYAGMLKPLKAALKEAGIENDDYAFNKQMVEQGLATWEDVKGWANRRGSQTIGKIIHESMSFDNLDEARSFLLNPGMTYPEIAEQGGFVSVDYSALSEIVSRTKNVTLEDVAASTNRFGTQIGTSMLSPERRERIISDWFSRHADLSHEAQVGMLAGYGQANEYVGEILFHAFMRVPDAVSSRELTALKGVSLQGMVANDKGNGVADFLIDVVRKDAKAQNIRNFKEVRIALNQSRFGETWHALSMRGKERAETLDDYLLWSEPAFVGQGQSGLDYERVLDMARAEGLVSNKFEPLFQKLAHADVVLDAGLLPILSREGLALTPKHVAAAYAGSPDTKETAFKGRLRDVSMEDLIDLGHDYNVKYAYWNNFDAICRNLRKTLDIQQVVGNSPRAKTSSGFLALLDNLNEAWDRAAEFPIERTALNQAFWDTTPDFVQMAHYSQLTGQSIGYVPVDTETLIEMAGHEKWADVAPYLDVTTLPKERNLLEGMLRALGVDKMPGHVANAVFDTVPAINGSLARDIASVVDERAADYRRSAPHMLSGEIRHEPLENTKGLRDWESHTLGNDVAPTIIPDKAGTAKDEVAKLLTFGADTGLNYDEADALVKQWAATSNGYDTRSLIIQKAAADEFVTDLSPWQEKRLQTAGKIKLFANSPDGDMNAEIARVKPALRAMYDATQKELREAGITELHLYRGVESLEGVKRTELAVGDIIKVRDNALASWTISTRVAKAFGFEGLVIDAVVPAEQVLSTCRTGFGCMAEEEVVVIGNYGDAFVRVYAVPEFASRPLPPNDKMAIKGGPGSGHFDHAGRPGEIGGSAPSDGDPQASDPKQAASNRKDAEHGLLAKHYKGRKFKTVGRATHYRGMTGSAIAKIEVKDSRGSRYIHLDIESGEVWESPIRGKDKDQLKPVGQYAGDKKPIDEQADSTPAPAPATNRNYASMPATDFLAAADRGEVTLDHIGQWLNGVAYEDDPQEWKSRVEAFRKGMTGTQWAKVYDASGLGSLSDFAYAYRDKTWIGDGKPEAGETIGVGWWRGSNDALLDLARHVENTSRLSTDDLAVVVINDKNVASHPLINTVLQRHTFNEVYQSFDEMGQNLRPSYALSERVDETWPDFASPRRRPTSLANWRSEDRELVTHILRNVREIEPEWAYQFAFHPYLTHKIISDITPIQQLENAGYLKRVANLSSGVVQQGDSQFESLRNAWGVAEKDERIVPARSAPSVTSAKWREEAAATVARESGFSHEESAEVITAWAEASNATTMMHLGMQEAVAEMFGIPVNSYQQGKFDAARSNRVWSQYPGQDKYGEAGAKERMAKATKSIYDRTQAWFKERGITHVTLYRGVSTRAGFDANSLVPGRVVDVEDNVLSSWSTDIGVAAGFALADSRMHLDGLIVSAQVPVERIFSTPFTGLGNLPEKEVVVIGGRSGTSSVTVGFVPGYEGDRLTEEQRRAVKSWAIKFWQDEDHPRYAAGTPYDPATGALGGRFAPNPNGGGGDDSQPSASSMVDAMIGKNAAGNTSSGALRPPSTTAGGGKTPPKSATPGAAGIVSAMSGGVKQPPKSKDYSPRLYALRQTVWDNYDPSKATPEEWVNQLIENSPNEYSDQDRKDLLTLAESYKKGTEDDGKTPGIAGSGTGKNGGKGGKGDEQQQQQQQPKGGGGGGRGGQNRNPTCQEVAESLSRHILGNDIIDRAEIDGLIADAQNTYGCPGDSLATMVEQISRKITPNLVTASALAGEPANPAQWSDSQFFGKAWDPQKHPRQPAGSSEGGQFAAAGDTLISARDLDSTNFGKTGGKNVKIDAQYDKRDLSAQGRWLEAFLVNPRTVKRALSAGLPSGMKAEARITGDFNFMLVEADLFGEDGNRAGFISYMYQKSSGAYEQMTIDRLELNKKYQGKNLALGLVEALVKQAARSKVEHVVLQADISIGKYAWAKYGFADEGWEHHFRPQKFEDWAKEAGIEPPAGGWPGLDKISTIQELAAYDPGVTVAGNRITNVDVNPNAQLKLGKAYLLDDVGYGEWNGLAEPKTILKMIKKMRQSERYM